MDNSKKEVIVGEALAKLVLAARNVKTYKEARPVGNGEYSVGSGVRSNFRQFAKVR